MASSTLLYVLGLSTMIPSKHGLACSAHRLFFKVLNGDKRNLSLKAVSKDSVPLSLYRPANSQCETQGFFFGCLQQYVHI